MWEPREKPSNSLPVPGGRGRHRAASVVWEKNGTAWEAEPSKTTWRFGPGDLNRGKQDQCPFFIFLLLACAKPELCMLGCAPGTCALDHDCSSSGICHMYLWALEAMWPGSRPWAPTQHGEWWWQEWWAALATHTVSRKEPEARH